MMVTFYSYHEESIQSSHVVLIQFYSHGKVLSCNLHSFHGLQRITYLLIRGVSEGRERGGGCEPRHIFGGGGDGEDCSTEVPPSKMQLSHSCHREADRTLRQLIGTIAMGMRSEGI